MSKRVLIVAYGFPPSNQVAIHRILRLSKWLPKSGWEPIILTVKTKYAHPYFYSHEDADLSTLVPDQLKVYRAPSFEHFKHPFWGRVQSRIMGAIAVPDSYVTWVPGGVLAGKKLVEEHHIDVVLTTVGPNSTALIGYFLKKLTSAKWVMDYRDPWCPNPFKKRGHVRFFLEKKIEDRILSLSDFNVTTSDLITEIYQKTYPSIADRFSTITNCYDHELQFVPGQVDVASPCNDKFRIIHSGAFYPKRNPTGFLKSLVALAAEHPELRDKIEVLFVGSISSDIKEEILRVAESTSIDCQLIGPLPYKESMQHISNSDLLLAINGIEERDNIFIPGKLFDYIAANKPILLIGHQGAASEIVVSGNLGAVRKHQDIDGIASEVLRFYRRWERSLPFQPYSEHILRYHASTAAKQLAAVLNSVVCNIPNDNQFEKE
jgi:glycosyltransferase involved in cell wall biosynthesis